MEDALGEQDPGREEEQQPAEQYPPRVQSPSSILTYKQCPRKYYYRYIAKLPTRTNIHLVRGKVAHQVLEDFYDIDLSKIPDASFPVTAKVILQEMFQKEWLAAADELATLDMSPEELDMYRDETKTMVNNFFHYLLDKLVELKEESLGAALERFKPRREIELRSPQHHVRGYADAVHEQDGKTYILDYKTSSKCEITPDYELQLSIYGMIFEELGSLPDEVGIFFLKHGQELKLPMTPEMVANAKREVHYIHENTGSKSISDYPMQPGPLCKWRTGQCDFYELCFGNKTLKDF